MTVDGEQSIAIWVEEAIELRRSASDVVPSEGSSPTRYQEALLVTRAALDRLQFLQAQMTRVRGGARRRARAYRYAADDAFNQAITQRRKQEYEGAQERNAYASLASFEQQRTAREAEHFQSVVEESYDVIKLCSDGLSSLRYDLVTSLRGFQFESSLER